MDASPARRRLPWAAVAALVVAAAIGGTALVVAVADGDGDRSPAPSEQIASVQQACERWVDSGPSGSESSESCRAMASWMNDQLSRDGMGPQMMWTSLRNLRDTCQQWLTDRPSTADETSNDSCTAMVDWMTGHMVSWSGHDNWNDWMTRGPMMGS